jgi:hypothetical protein
VAAAAEVGPPTAATVATTSSIDTMSKIREEEEEEEEGTTALQPTLVKHDAPSNVDRGNGGETEAQGKDQRDVSKIKVIKRFDYTYMKLGSSPCHKLRGVTRFMNRKIYAYLNVVGLD